VLDLIIRNGFVVDGTGRPGRYADVAIHDGRIEAIGHIEGQAVREIDATGRVVAPGFVDIHTHFDAQVFWDPAATPSSLHGITTVIGGNCGFTIAPLVGDPAESDYIMRMLARVEAMPLQSLQMGVPWDWKTYGEYLDRLDGRVGVNVGFMVGHSTIRRAVMGPAAVERVCTPQELVAMQGLLRESLEAGGLGFSSSNTKAHNDAEGRPVPSRHAGRDEVIGLAGTVGTVEGTVLQWNPTVAHAFRSEDVALMVEMTIAAGRPLNWNVLGVSAQSRENAYALLSASDVAKQRGGRIVSVAGASGSGARFCLASGFVFDVFPGWGPVMSLPRLEKLEALKDDSLRAELKVLAQREDNEFLSFTNWSALKVYEVFAPENQQYEGRTFGEIGIEQGRDPWDVLWDIAIADELLTRFGTVAPQPSEADWQARAEIWCDERVVVGASDAGAHVDMIAGFDYPTRVLSELVRMRSLLKVEEAVRLLADVPARLYGLRERGRLEEGWHADVVVFDPTTIDTNPPEVRSDFPGGAGRLYSEPTGIDHVLVNGTAVVIDGKPVASEGGMLLRSGRDTQTVAA
jgi:N-acyl-D-aspartate/D-glutamate deacylase